MSRLNVEKMRHQLERGQPARELTPQEAKVAKAFAELGAAIRKHLPAGAR